MDHQAFALRFPNPASHPLLNTATIFLLHLLHIVDYNGVAAHAVGNILFEIIHDHELGHRSQDAALEWVNGELAKFYTTFRVSDRTYELLLLPLVHLLLLLLLLLLPAAACCCLLLPAAAGWCLLLPLLLLPRIGELTMAMLFPGSVNTTTYPQLSGPSIKGASTRALVPFVKQLAAQCVDGSKLRARRFDMISALDEWYETLYSGGLFLTAEQQQKMGDIVHKQLINYI